MNETKILYEAQDNLLLCFDGLVGGSPDEPVRWICITLGGKHAQYERHITVSFLRPRKRREEGYYLTPDGGAWYYVKDLCGNVKFDTRTVFPCWSSLDEYREHAQQRHGYGPGPENDAAVARWDAMVIELK